MATKILKGALILVGLGFVGFPLLLWLQNPVYISDGAEALPTVSQVSFEDAIAQYKDGLLSSPNMSAYVSEVRAGLADGMAEVEVTPLFLAETQANREALAVALWKTWAYSATPSGGDVDKARIRLVDAQGKQVGGSRAIAGSVIYVDD